MKHENCPIGQNHKIYNWEFLDESSRLSLTGLSILDVGKIAIQKDDNSLWILINETGVWKDISGFNQHTLESNPHPQYLQHNEHLEFPLSGGTITIINHNLGRSVLAETYTIGGQRFISEISKLSNNQIQITLSYPLNGYVIIQ